MFAEVPFLGLGGPAAAPGTIHIVGGGPGDPAALTLRAATVLATCDVVAHDHLSPREALDLVPAHADRILVGRRSGRPGYERDELDELLLARAAAGQAVVRLKGGDPFVFGRGGEEARACVAAGIPYEVVPGVTAAVAVPGAAGIPVTHRGVAPGFVVVTGHGASGAAPAERDLAALAAFPGTLVLLMGLSRVHELAAALLAHGKAPTTPVAVVAHGTLPTQRTVRATLATLPDELARREVTPPAVVVVGAVVDALADHPGREGRPLHGRRVLLPYVGLPPRRVAQVLRHAGAAVVELVVGHHAAPDPASLARLAVDLRERRIGTLVVTSIDGLRSLLDVLPRVGADVRVLADVCLCTTSDDTTSALRDQLGLVADRLLPASGEVTEGVTGPVVTLATDGDDEGLADAFGGRCVATSRMVAVDDVEVAAVDVVVVTDRRVAARLDAARIAAGTPRVAHLDRDEDVVTAVCAVTGGR